MTTPDPFAAYQEALSDPMSRVFASNAYCPDCDVRWRAKPDQPKTWDCWVCGEERKPNPKTSAQTLYDQFMESIGGAF